MEKKKLLHLFFILIFLLNFTIQKNQNLEQNIINNYYPINLLEQNLFKNLDEFIEGNLNNTKNKITYNYNITLNKTKDTGQIVIDYQSEYGCLYITLKDENIVSENEINEFCSQGKNNIFEFNISDFVVKEEGNIIMNIIVEYNSSEYNPTFNFDFSLKVSLKKIVNIIEINSSHKILCQMDNNFGDKKNRCLFMIVNKNETNNNIQDTNSIIIFPLINEYSDQLNIYADYINKSFYEEFNKDDLNNLIPNESSSFINKMNGKKTNFIRITNESYNKFIYVSIESKNISLLQVISTKISENETKGIFSPNNMNDVKLFSINKSFNLTLDINKSEIPNYIFSLNTIHGKSTLYIDNNDKIKYTVDSRESNLILDIDPKSCSSEKCNLIFDKIDDEHIFYISYIKKEINSMHELIYGKSIKLSLNGIKNNILLYEYLPIQKEYINVNLQLYTFISSVGKNDTFNVELFFLSKNNILEIAKNESYINNFNETKKGEINPIILATNFHLQQDLNENNSYILIKITPSFDCSEETIILGVTISAINSLIYPSERIYHYGELANNTKITYRLEGQKKYHLMRLEFGHNSEDLKWTVNRNNYSENYMNNDSDISFVIEYWKNGRELLTMYIEDGEDIYLTIYKAYTGNNLKRNYAFKYINSGKNGDFKNYIIKQDYLEYNVETRDITMNKLWKTPPSNTQLQYYLRIIKEKDYLNNEVLNSISLIESTNIITTKYSSSSDTINYNLKEWVDKYANYYTNCYITIIENNNDIELVSYQSSMLEALKVKSPSIGLIIAAICVTGVVFIIFFIRLMHHCCCLDDYSYSYNKRTYDSYLI